MEKKEIMKALEKYQIEGVLGKGATAEIYLGKEIETGNEYAIKVSDNVSLLSQEADILRQVQGNIVFPQFLDYVQGEKGYLVMEYIRGRNLQELLDEFGRFELGEAVWIMKEVLKGLAYLHSQEPPLIYRDLKPTNIMIEESGRVRLIDLGGCFCLKEGKKQENIVHAGTYGYAAPEQFWAGIIPEPACDVHAAGKLLGYLLTGRNPALPPYHVEQYYQRDKKIPAPLKNVLKRCMAENVQARYKNGEVLLREMEKVEEVLSEKRRLFLQRSGDIIYKKCIWLSEYRRIF